MGKEMEPKFEPRGFHKRLKSMMGVDFYRLFHTPMYYIFLAIAAIIPAMVLSMTGMENADGVARPLYTNTWNIIAADIPLYIVNNIGDYANMNMVFIFGGIMVSIFIGHDYKSGYVKQLFTTHSKKIDYMLSKSIAMALLGQPRLLVLDEPINGLDADGMRIMREVLVDITETEECSVLISSHILGELEKIATHYGVIRGGKMIREMTAEELDENCRTYISLAVADTGKTKMLLSSRFSRVEEDENGNIRVYDLVEPEDVVTFLYQNGILIREIKKDKIGLEEYYIDLMKGGR